MNQCELFVINVIKLINIYFHFYNLYIPIFQKYFSSKISFFLSIGNGKRKFFLYIKKYFRSPPRFLFHTNFANYKCNKCPNS